MNKYTSLKFSKWLQDNGFEGESEMYQSSQLGLITKETFLSHDPYNQDKLQDDGFRQAVEETYLAFDILNDLCVRYGKELFGDALDIMTEKNFLETYTNKTYAKDLYKRIIKTPMYVIYSEQIIRLLQQNRKYEAELYIRKYCVLNSKNKL